MTEIFFTTMNNNIITWPKNWQRQRLCFEHDQIYNKWWWIWPKKFISYSHVKVGRWRNILRKMHFTVCLWQFKMLASEKRSLKKSICHKKIAFTIALNQNLHKLKYNFFMHRKRHARIKFWTDLWNELCTYRVLP